MGSFIIIPSIFSLLILLTLPSDAQTSPLPYCNTPDQPSTLKIYHIYSHCSPFKPTTPLSFEDSVLQMESKDQARLLFLNSLVAGRTVVPIASGRGVVQSPTYIVRVKIGTPAQTLMMAMDTSNDAAWVPSEGCLGCSGGTLFKSKLSRTFKKLPCGLPQCQQVPNPSCLDHTCTFNMTYGSSSIAANLTQDTLRLGTDPIPNYTFGSIQKTTGSSVPPQGLLGLGRGPLSLLSQTKNLYQSTFSYCLPSFKSLNFSGSLRLGPLSQPKNIKYTQLLSNPFRSSLYYVNLVGIKVANKVLDIPLNALAHNPNTGAGTIIDSGTVFTRLVQPAYLAVRNEFRRRMGKAIVSSLGGFDTCYTVPVTVPSITFMFSGMNVSLTQDNFLIHSTAGSTTCLAMAAAPTDNVNSVLNVIANMQQQNHRVLFDLPNNRLGVARELCT